MLTERISPRRDLLPTALPGTAREQQSTFRTTRLRDSGSRTTCLSTSSPRDMTRRDSLSRWSRPKVGALLDILILISKLNLWSLISYNLDTQPNVDYFTRDELKKLVKKFKDDTANGQLNDVSIATFVLISKSLSQLVIKKQHSRDIYRKNVRRSHEP